MMRYWAWARDGLRAEHLAALPGTRFQTLLQSRDCLV
ncbi:hypothetical protein OKW43_007237 [Paraburkholderia sp. WC7.3g]